MTGKDLSLGERLFQDELSRSDPIGEPIEQAFFSVWLDGEPIFDILHDERNGVFRCWATTVEWEPVYDRFDAVAPTSLEEARATVERIVSELLRERSGETAEETSGETSGETGKTIEKE